MKEMICRLDGRRPDGERSVSPSKRPRSDTYRDSSVSSAASVDDPASDQPVTAQSIAALMRTMSQQIRDDIAAQFSSLREEIGEMNGRIRSLEQHMEDRDNYIQEVEERLRAREAQVAGLESEVDHLSSELRKKDLILSGPAVPAPPAQAWTEDVTATAVETLGRFLPDVPVARGDIAECYRLSRGKRILCRFRECGKGSVRDRVYEGRFGARLSAAAAGEDGPVGGAASPGRAMGGGDSERLSGSVDGTAEPSFRAGGRGDDRGPVGERQRLYVSENLTRKRQDIFQELLNLKRSRQIYTVFTKNGEVFCKTMQFGRKIRVGRVEDIPNALRG